MNSRARMAIHGEMDDSRQKRNLIPLKKALERGGFGRTKAYKLIKKGKIMAYKMEGRTMVDAVSIDAYHMTPLALSPAHEGKR
jgi:hypothetical protein